jgi:hypothetical protein
MALDTIFSDSIQLAVGQFWFLHVAVTPRTSCDLLTMTYPAVNDGEIVFNLIAHDWNNIQKLYAFHIEYLDQYIL